MSRAPVLRMGAMTTGPKPTTIAIRGTPRAVTIPADPAAALVRRLEFVLAALADTSADVRDLMLDLQVVVRDDAGETIFPRPDDLAPCPFAGQPLEDWPAEGGPTWVTCLCGRRAAVIAGDDENHAMIAEHRPGDELRRIVDELSRAKAATARAPAPAKLDADTVKALVAGVLGALKS